MSDEQEVRCPMPDARAALSHAKARFECLAEHFDGLADDVSRAMCEVDAEWMTRALDASPQQLQQRRSDVIEECASVLDSAAQDWHRIRDPGMANNAKSYARQIRALVASPPAQEGTKP